MSEPRELGVAANLVHHAPRRFVLVTGAGRSGTSTVAGSLNYLGLHVPRPFLGSNKSNPRGFFESRWPIQFHREILDRVHVDIVDGRPDALQQVREVLTPDDRAKVERWLLEEGGFAPQLAVKDPRSAWMPGIWLEAAHDAGLRGSYLTMIRHPAEVVGSRATYYAKGDEQHVRRYQVTSLGRWINANLITEHQTRGATRTFVRYQDLIENWRKAMSRVRDDLDLVYNTDLAAGEPHPLDDFIDPALRRHQVTWDEIDMPVELREIAEETWRALETLADGRGADEHADATLDSLAERYARLFENAAAIAHDVTAAEVKRARQVTERQTRARMRKQLAAKQPATSVAGAPRPPILSKVATAVRRRIGR